MSRTHDHDPFRSTTGPLQVYRRPPLGNRSPAHTPPICGPRDTGRMRVLLVEDEQPLATYIATGLHRHGCVVDMAHDGQQALDRCDITPYDVVILDRDLPVVHGDTVCRRLA